MSSNHVIEEEVPPGRVLVRTADNRPIVTADAVRSLSPIFADYLAVGEPVLRVGGRDRIRWHLPGGAVLDNGSPGSETFVNTLRQCCNEARNNAALLSYTAWYRQNGGSEPADKYAALARLFGRSEPTTATQRVRLPQALVHHVHDLFSKAADSIEEALDAPKIYRDEASRYRLVGWGVRAEDALLRHQHAPAPQLRLDLQMVAGQEHVMLNWTPHPDYGEVWIERADSNEPWEEVGHASVGVTRYDLGAKNSVPPAQFRVRVLTRAGEVVSAPVQVSALSQPPPRNPPTEIWPSDVGTLSPQPPARPQSVRIVPEPNARKGRVSWTAHQAEDLEDCDAHIELKDKRGEWIRQASAPAAAGSVEIPEIDGRTPHEARVRFARCGINSEWVEGKYVPEAHARPRSWLKRLLLLLLGVLLLVLLSWLISRCSSTPSSQPPVGHATTNKDRIVGTDTRPDSSKAGGPTSDHPNSRTGGPSPSTPRQAPPTRAETEAPVVQPPGESADLAIRTCPACGQQLPPCTDESFKYCPYCGGELKGPVQTPRSPATSNRQGGASSTWDYVPALAGGRPISGRPTRSGAVEEPPQERSATDSASPLSNDASNSNQWADSSSRPAPEVQPSPAQEPESGNREVDAQLENNSSQQEGHDHPARSVHELKPPSTIPQPSPTTPPSDPALQDRPSSTFAPHAPSEDSTDSAKPRVASPRELYQDVWKVCGAGLRLKFLEPTEDDNCFESPGQDAPASTSARFGIVLRIPNQALSDQRFEQIRAMRLESGEIRSYGIAFCDVDAYPKTDPLSPSSLWLAAVLSPAHIPEVERPVSLAQTGGPDATVTVSRQTIRIAGCAATIWMEVDTPAELRDSRWQNQLTVSFEPDTTLPDQVHPQWVSVPSPVGGGKVRLLCSCTQAPIAGRFAVKDSKGNVVVRTKTMRVEFHD